MKVLLYYDVPLHLSLRDPIFVPSLRIPYLQVKGFFPFLGQFPLQQSLFTVQDVPAAEQLLGRGAGVGGVSPPDWQAAHQHFLPPFPHSSCIPAVEQAPPASDPSAQIVESKG